MLNRTTFHTFNAVLLVVFHISLPKNGVLPMPRKRDLQCTKDCLHNNGYFLAPARYSRMHPTEDTIEPVTSFGERSWGFCICFWSDSFRHLVFKRLGFHKVLLTMLGNMFSGPAVFLQKIRVKASAQGLTFYSYEEIVAAVNARRIAWNKATPNHQPNWRGAEETLIMTPSGFQAITGDDLKTGPTGRLKRRKTLREHLQEAKDRR